ncbi:hypothetical protein IU450_31635 [Nocardia abscessus]|uniref:hypothetical protein n=1 Tax=Nocardia abscessus TaxID=120957 RepID=UPI0018957BCA|nr:hypothetical protein [Nocardia abscessus]MBF6340412.1 hypothetical protein [Nocardia abscessus]
MDRIRAGRAATAVAVVLACLTATGCGDSDDKGAAPDASTTSTAAPRTPTEDPRGNEGKPFIADPTIVGAHPIPFQSWTRLADNKIAVNFETGSPECYGADATVTESASTVTVELRSGSRAEAVGRMCTMIAVFGTLEVPLKEPLGNRTVLSAV